jgi:hypothetical protein
MMDGRKKKLKEKRAKKNGQKLQTKATNREKYGYKGYRNVLISNNKR